MKVVGLDLSLRSAGLVALRDDAHVLQERRIEDGKKTDGPRRLQRLRDQVSDELYGLNPDIIVMENYAYGARNQAHQVGELGGVIRLAMYEMGLTYVTVPPNTLKKFVTGKGNSPKDTMLKAVYKRWGFDTDSNDIADGYGLARIGLCIVAEKTAKQFRHDVLKNLTCTLGSGVDPSSIFEKIPRLSQMQGCTHLP